MPDWRQALRSQLDHLRLSPEREAEIIEEVSQHLDERYEDIRRSGARGVKLVLRLAPGS